MNINYKYICENNFILSLLISIICTTVIYIDDRYNNIKKPIVGYIKIVVLVVIGVNGVLYLKNKHTNDVKCNYNNVKIGEPNF